jgi:hypothetical protein
MCSAEGCSKVNTSSGASSKMKMMMTRPALYSWHQKYKKEAFLREASIE